MSNDPRATAAETKTDKAAAAKAAAAVPETDPERVARLAEEAAKKAAAPPPRLTDDELRAEVKRLGDRVRQLLDSAGIGGN